MANKYFQLQYLIFRKIAIINLSKQAFSYEVTYDGLEPAVASREGWRVKRRGRSRALFQGDM